MSNTLIPNDWLEPGEGRQPPHAFDASLAQDTSLLKLGLDLGALLRRNLLLVLAATVAVIAVAVFQLSQQVPTYLASAVVRVADRSPLSAQTAARAPMISQSTLLSQIQILQSRAVAREVVDREGLRLVVDSQSSRSSLRGLVTLKGARPLVSGWIDRVRLDSNVTARRLSLGFSPTDVVISGDVAPVRVPYGVPFDGGGVHFVVARNPEVARLRLAVTSVDAAVNQVLRSLRARAREGTDILDVSYQDDDPARAQRVVNSAIQSFQGLEARTAKQASVRRRHFIEQQLQKTETLLAEALLAQNNFRNRTQVYNTQDQLKAQQTDLTGLEVRRQELMTDRKQLVNLQQTLAQPRRAGIAERLTVLMSSPIVATNTTLGQLYTQLAQLHTTRDSMTSGSFARSLQDPDVRRLDAVIAATDTRLTGAIAAQISAVDARLQALDEIKGKTSEKMATLPKAEAEETSLLSETDTYRKEAERLRDQAQGAQIEEAAEAGQIEIVDLATLPDSPIGSGRTQRLLFALILGLTIGMGAAYALENHKSVIRNRVELERAIPVANLALIPQIKVKKKEKALKSSNGTGGRSGKALPGLVQVAKGESGLVTVSDNRSTSAEAFRTLRTNLLFSSALRSVHSLIVTSASPKEGKSTTSANLAVAFAQQGQRVLIIDCDLRRPSQHKLFAVRQHPGITEVLNEKVVMANAVVKTSVPNLSLLTAGSIPSNPGELLGGPEMRAMLDGLRANYDMVIIDTPPLLAASDSAILSKLTDGVIVVVRAGMTERAAVMEGIHQLENVGARILGTVLNDPDAEVAKYATYYRYYYNNYYGYAEAKS